jgi:hypothetical protein
LWLSVEVGPVEERGLTTTFATCMSLHVTTWECKDVTETIADFVANAATRPPFMEHRWLFRKPPTRFTVFYQETLSQSGNSKQMTTSLAYTRSPSSSP